MVLEMYFVCLLWVLDISSLSHCNFVFSCLLMVMNGFHVFIGYLEAVLSFLTVFQLCSFDYIYL